MSEMTKTLLEMQNVSKEYNGNPVLKDVNFTLKQGEVLGLVGENGAGKSTLMNILFGMDVIQQTGGYGGKVLIDGKEVKYNKDDIEQHKIFRSATILLNKEIYSHSFV